MRSSPSPEFIKIYRQLVVADTQLRLPGEPVTEIEKISAEECAELVSKASILALSAKAEHRSMAYEIVTRVVATLKTECPSLICAADFILARLGNFPGRSLLRMRHPEYLDKEKTLSPYLDFEAIAREAENTVEDAGGEFKALTNFQYDTLDDFSRWPSVSVSAPTSAGKSFVLSLEVIRKLSASAQPCIVYLVPTRALIRQVVTSLREDLLKARLGEVAIRSVPTPIARDLAPNGIVYVLTQERLLSLLHSDQGEVWITTLIVDEAQGIGDGSRGVLLHAAIDEVVRRFEKSDIFFASPMAKNPEYLLDLFGLENGRRSLEEHSPVAQNLILVSPGESNPNNVGFEVLLGGEAVYLGERNLAFSVSGGGILSRRASFAKIVAAKDGCCIVYCNGARDSEKIAEEIASQLSDIPELDARIAEFIIFLQEYIHEDYGLISVLRKGVAFHYSNMPGSVRSGVEDLCKDGLLKFICCTSTLLQGVNLPARDIVVENPKRGQGKPMKRPDFVNLAGRAGRLLREFHGNVWCLRPDLWEERSFSGEPLQLIESAFSRCLKDGGTTIRQAYDDDPRMSDRDRDTAIASLTLVYTDYISKGRSLWDTGFADRGSEESLGETISKLEGMECTLPTELFRKNQGILPMRLEDLATHFREADDILGFIPIAPFVSGVNSRLSSIFEITERKLQRDTTNRYKYYCHVAKEWIHQNLLKEIIVNSLTYLASIGQDYDTRDVIYKIIEDLEKVIRHRFVKHLRAYNDVLGVILREKGFFIEADSLIPMHLYLECGASDPDVLGLISIGLSRTSALLLKKRIHFPKESTPEDCMRVLSKVNFKNYSIPAFILREVQSLLGDQKN